MESTLIAQEDLHAHTRFTKEFRDEAVRLALTSGRSRRKVVADLGVGLSTLRHWIDRRREREIDDPPENGLKARQKRRFKRTTDSHHAFPIAPNLLEQDFSATRPNQKWNADISYVWTGEGWLYLAVVLDLFARRVVGWAVSDRLHKELALEGAAQGSRDPKTR